MKKKVKFSHTNPSPKGMGDFYGTGIKAKIGQMRDGAGQIQTPPKKIGTPPKTLA